MFKIDQSETFTWPVEVMIAGNGGKFSKETFDVEFKRVTSTRLDEIAKDVAMDKIGDREVCLDVVTGWSGITDKGEALPYSQENLQRLLDVPGVSRAICTAFVSAHKAATVKN